MKFVSVEDYRGLPQEVTLHGAFCYAAYEVPYVEDHKKIYKSLKGFQRIVHETFYSIFRKENEIIIAVRGTYWVDIRDLWQDLQVILTNRCFRTGWLNTNIRAFLDKIIASGEDVSVTLTGHSLGGAMSAQIYNDLIQEQKYKQVLRANYALNPFVSKFFFGRHIWTAILSEPTQKIIVTDGDCCWKGLNKVTCETLNAQLYKIDGLQFGGFSAHDVPACFTPKEKKESMTDIELNSYLLAKECVSDSSEFELTPPEMRWFDDIIAYRRREVVEYYTRGLYEHLKVDCPASLKCQSARSVPWFLWPLMKIGNYFDS